MPHNPPRGGRGLWTFRELHGTLHEGVVDSRLSGSSTRPFHEGVVDGGLSKTLEPITRGGGTTK